jgi:hypothetical protein
LLLPASPVAAAAPAAAAAAACCGACPGFRGLPDAQCPPDGEATAHPHSQVVDRQSEAKLQEKGTAAAAGMSVLSRTRCKPSCRSRGTAAAAAARQQACQYTAHPHSQVVDRQSEAQLQE